MKLGGNKRKKARSPSSGESQLWEGKYHADYFTSSDQDIPDWWLKIPLLGESETVISLNCGLLMWGLAQVTPFWARYQRYLYKNKGQYHMSRDNCDKFQSVNLKQTKVYGYNGIKNSTSTKKKQKQKQTPKIQYPK